MLPKHNGYGFISESLALSWYIFYIFFISTNKKLSLTFQCWLNTNLLSNSVKLVRYIAFAVHVVLVLCQELNYLFFYYQYALMDPY